DDAAAGRDVLNDGVEVDGEVGAGRAAEDAVNAVDLVLRDDRVIRHVVGTGAATPRGVRRQLGEVVPQGDGQERGRRAGARPPLVAAPVVEQQVAADGVARAGRDVDPVVLVEGDDVRGRGRGAADGVVRAVVRDEHAAAAVTVAQADAPPG